jgi:hypothetical protein
MTIIDESGGPLPDGHPFKGMQNISGAKRPAAPSDTSPQQPATPPDGDQTRSREQESAP